MSKKMRIIVGVLLAAVCVCIAAALIFPVDKTIIYRSGKVTVKQAEHENRRFVHYTRLGVTAEQAFTNNAVILSGTIRNVREATVSYNVDGTEGEGGITLFDMSVSDVLFSSTNELPKKGDLTIGVGYNNSCFADGLPSIEEGKNYLMFCILTADREPDPLETKRYADLWVFYPSSLLFEQLGDQLVISNVFADYFSEDDLISSRLGISETQAKELKNSNDFVTKAKALSIKDDIGFFSSLEGRYIVKSAELEILLETGYLVEKDAFVELLRQKVEELW